MEKDTQRKMGRPELSKRDRELLNDLRSDMFQKDIALKYKITQPAVSQKKAWFDEKGYNTEIDENP